jgi:O-acetyl-ADP-ribose deacetylase (regulator of RNase III)
MLTYVAGSIWASPAQTLVNTVNVVGAMGKGIALEFKKRYPKMYEGYRHLCKEGKFKIGMLWLYRAPDRYVLNFPTKEHWRRPSKPEYIKKGLEKFVDKYNYLGITSISFPQLGCGHGGLGWESEVQPLMEAYLKKLPIPIYVHLRPQNAQFVPEHLLPVNQAIPFESLIDDLKELGGREYRTLTTGNSFIFKGIQDGNGNGYLVFLRGKNEVKIPIEHLRMLWDDLHQYRLLSSRDAPGRIAKEHALIFALLKEIPYIQLVSSAHNYTKFINQPAQSLVLAKKAKDDTSAHQLSLPL